MAFAALGCASAWPEGEGSGGREGKGELPGLGLLGSCSPCLLQVRILTRKTKPFCFPKQKS